MAFDMPFETMMIPGAGTILLLGPIVFMIIGLVSVARTSGMDGRFQLAWIALVIFAPIVGTLVWFLVGRRSDELQGRGGYSG